MKKVIFNFALFFWASISLNLYAQVTYKEITLTDQWKTRTFFANSVYGINSMNDGIHYSTLSNSGNIDKYSYATGLVIDTIFDAQYFELNIDDYQFNKNETKILLVTDKTPIYRRSFTAEYYVYDIKSKNLKKVSENGKQQVASFSPDAEKIAFIRNNNMFIKDLITDEETQMTFDGEFNKIINGIPDWVYEEEFEFNKAYEWSPDGKKIAYIKFNETDVRLFGMTMFAGLKPSLTENKLYPEYRTFKYPKAGEANSIVSVHIFDLETKKTITADIGNEKDIYIPRLRWTKKIETFSIFRMNRLQNIFELLYANSETGETNVVYSETNKYYFDEVDFDNLQFTDDGKNFIMTSERDGYRHIYWHDINGKPLKQITSGKQEVTDFLGYDSENSMFYYQSTDESPIYRAVYKSDLSGKVKEKLSTQKGTNTAEFSTNFKYYINFFSNSKTPNYITLHDTKGKVVKVLEDNADLNQTIESYGGSRKEFISFTTSEGIELNAWMIKPLNFNPDKKYPVILTQYSGPGSQEVLDEWSFYYAWEHLLSQKGAVVMCVDPRGTGGRGEEFKKLTYLQIGKYETVDLIETAKWLQQQSYINPEKIGIWGWSYGGFMTSLCMTKGADYFSTGIAVAPVTNWRYYDNIYTERFMRTPQENPGGYDDNSPINYANLLKGNFLIVHGSADDNVHWQNTAEFTETLIQADKQFEQFIYTNRNHGIYGGNTRFHLYTMMLNFWEEHLLN